MMAARPMPSPPTSPVSVREINGDAEQVARAEFCTRKGTEYTQGYRACRHRAAQHGRLKKIVVMLNR